VQAESVDTFRNGTPLLNLGYSYGALGAPNDGNPLSHTISGSLVNGVFTQNYSVNDLLNRLTNASETNSGGTTWTQTYVHDERGNRALWTTGTGNTWIADGTGSGTYTPQTPSMASVPYNQYNQWSGATYGNTGSQNQVGARRFTYDGEGRVVSA
jgi:hypothetical protein